MDEPNLLTSEMRDSNDELVVWLVTRGGALRLDRTETEPRSSLAETGSEFVWSPRPDNRVSLRLRSTTSYLSVLGTGELALSEAGAGSEQEFDLVEAEGMPGLRLAGTDRLLSVRPDKDADTEAALLVDFQGLLGCCCGKRSARFAGDGALWNDHTHDLIVETATERILGPLQEHALLVKLLYQLWHREFPGFNWKHTVYHAMRTTDYILPWARTEEFGFLFYNDHFFDPATGKNYRGEDSSAVTVGTFTFRESVRSWKEGQHHQAAVFLGRSLHFLTDLTQPMHAANFTNLSGPILAHAGLEKYAEEKVLRHGFFANYPSGTIRDLHLTHDNVTDFLLDVARSSKRVFISTLEKFLEDRRRDINPTWPPEIADRCLANSLLPAPRTVARYLVLWAVAIGLGGSLNDSSES